jgi:hypothetical protein
MISQPIEVRQEGRSAAQQGAGILEKMVAGGEVVS